MPLCGSIPPQLSIDSLGKDEEGVVKASGEAAVQEFEYETFVRVPSDLRGRLLGEEVPSSM